MRIAILGVGSRGDVQPMVVLGSELRRRGHEVTVGLPADMASFGTPTGLKTVALELRTKDFLDSDEGRRWLASGDIGSYIKKLFEYRLKVAGMVQPQLRDMTRDADVIVSGQLTEGEAACIAEARHVPLVGVYHAPWRANRFFPPLYMTQRKYPGAVNRLAHSFAIRLERRVTAGYINEFRAKLGLPRGGPAVPVAMERSGVLEIQAYSRHLVPELAGWHPRRPLVGFLGPSREQRHLLGEDELDPAVERWLAEGTPPVFVGFGSMPVQDVPAMLTMIGAFSQRLGLRVLVGAGSSPFRPEDVPDEGKIRVVGAIDHDRVLPRCRLAVHHGGAGTTAASVKAGLPAVICSVAFDQPFWGRQLEKLGVGRTLPFTGLNADSLLRAAEPLLAAEPKRRAARLAALLRAEDAASRAADLVEKTVAAQRR